MVSGDAASGREALQTIPELRPDLVIVDLSIPGMNGLDLLKQLRVIVPDLPCLVVTAHSEALYAEHCNFCHGKNAIARHGGSVPDLRFASPDTHSGWQAIVVGGTHLYIKALLDGLFEGPEPDPARRSTSQRGTGRPLERRNSGLNSLE